MPFVKQLPHWGAPGIEPPLSLRQNGWKAGVKPPDEYFNYLQNRAYEALKELQENAVHKDDAGSGVTNLGFRGLLADPNGIGGPANIDKYPEGLSALYTDSPDWAVFLNMTDFVSALEFLFVETNKTIQDGKVNATQQITRYKKESNATPVKLISQYKRVWYSDANYTGWSNAEKVVFQTEFATHLAESAEDAHKISNIAGLQNALDAKLATNLRDVPNGYVGLGANGLIPINLLSAKVASGSFTGNGANRSIIVGFKPKLVFITRVTNSQELIIMGATGSYDFNSSGVVGTKAGNTHSTGFSISIHYGNQSGIVYDYIALG